jgi:DNA-binding CsgD family transcriptional regulator/tetratricopeptide (TPR) repeat protein
LLQSAALLAWRRGEPARSEDFSRRSLPLFQKSGDRYHLAGTFHNLGAAAELQSKYAEASRHYGEALRLREEVGDKPGAAGTLHNLGNLAREQGDLERAAALYECGLALQRETGNKRGIALALSGLGVIALDKGDYALSVAVSTESHNLYQELGSKSQNAMVLQNLGFAAMHLGEHARAVEFQNHCLRLTVENGDKRGIACGLEGVAAAIALFDTSRQSAERSARIFGVADALREELNVPLPPADFALMERSMTTVRNMLGEEAFNAAWAAGRTLPLEQVVTEALDATDLQAVSKRHPAVASSPVSLSRRESEVARLIARGHTNAQIAATLGMARPTADKHVSNILRKLGFSSRSDVSAWAIEHGLAPDATAPAS